MFILRLLSWTIINPSVGSPAPRWRLFARLTRGGRERRQNPPLFSDGRRKGWKIKEDSSSTRSTKLEPTHGSPFRSFFRRGWRTGCFERSPWVRCSPLWQYAGRAFSYTTPATVFCRFLERACFIFCVGNVCRGVLIRKQMKRREKREATDRAKSLFLLGQTKTLTACKIIYNSRINYWFLREAIFSSSRGTKLCGRSWSEIKLRKQSSKATLGFFCRSDLNALMAIHRPDNHWGNEASRNEVCEILKTRLMNSWTICAFERFSNSLI